MTEELEKIKRSIRVNRILLLSVLCLFFFIIVGAFVGIIQLSKIISMYKPTIDALAKVDFKGIADQVKSINLPELSKRVEAVDAHLSTLASSFKELKEVMEHISMFSAPY